MRISDWSSDVCSSDLLIAAIPHLHGHCYVVHTRTAGVRANDEFHRQVETAHPVDGLGAWVAVIDQQPAAAADEFAIRYGDQIGRASGRERVCQYVLI